MLTKLIEITRAGGDLASEMKRQPQAITSKDGSSWNYATQVDPAVEALIVGQLKEQFPDIPIIAEEQDEHKVPGATFFTVDPLDGTIPFSNGFPNWGTIIGYIQDGQPHAGIIYLPEQGILVHAEKGNGCYLNDQRVALDYQRPLAATVLAAELGPWIPEDGWVAMSRLRKKCRWLGGTGFAAAGVVSILQGLTGAYPNFFAKIWDFSAGAIAIAEAGGVVCHPKTGRPLTWDQIDIQALFAANQGLATEIVEVIAQS